MYAHILVTLAVGLQVTPQLGGVARQAAATCRGGLPVCKQKLDPEEVVEKYGLEAGLFSAIKKDSSSSPSEGDSETGATATAGDLLKRYGGAYLLTSTSFALISFGLCYLAVDNGVDVSSLLQKVGLEVIVPKEAGTIGIAYAIHKAASPIRFPPTVALTPVVAKRLFNNDGTSADSGGEGAE